MSEDLQKDFYSFLYIGDVLIEKGIVQELEKFLCYRRGRVYHIDNDAEARAIVENYKVSAIIIDQYLPHCSGLELMHWLQSFAMIPVVIIVMNSSSQATDIVVALEAGAADAVPGDISPRELAARVRACIRKYFHGNRDVMLGSSSVVGPVSGKGKRPLYYNPNSRRLYFSDTSRSMLHGKEADLLMLLIAKFPNYIDREEISQHLFQQEWNPQDRRIDNLVSRLRKIVDASDIDAADSAIETVRNEGYRLRDPIALNPLEKKINLAYTNESKSSATS